MHYEFGGAYFRNFTVYLQVHLLTMAAIITIMTTMRMIHICIKRTEKKENYILLQSHLKNSAKNQKIRKEINKRTCHIWGFHVEVQYFEIIGCLEQAHYEV